MSIREDICDAYPDVDLLFMGEEEYDAAILGVSVMCLGTQNNHQVIYDYDKVIEINAEMCAEFEDPWTEAIAHFDHNQGGSYNGPHTPIFIRKAEHIIEEI